MRYQAVIFDIGGAIDLEFAWEIAVDGAIASACGLEGIRVDQAMIEEASERAVAAFAADAHTYMVETLCGDPRTIERVRRRVRGMIGALEVFQLRPGIDGALRRLHGRGLALATLATSPAAADHLEQVGVGKLFAYQGPATLGNSDGPDPRALAMAAEALAIAPAACIMVGDRIDQDITPAKALGMAAIQFRGGRYRRQQPRSAAETPDAVVTDVVELEAAIDALLTR